MEAVTPPGPLESSSIDGLLFISAVRKVEDFMSTVLLGYPYKNRFWETRTLVRHIFLWIIFSFTLGSSQQVFLDVFHAALMLFSLFFWRCNQERIIMLKPEIL